MKLASYADGSRDGHLVVVSRDLTQAHYATGIATRLQQVLDDWGFIAPQLEDLAVQLNHGKLRHAFAFEPAKCLAPLPRAHGWAVVDAEGGVRREVGGFAAPHQPLRAPAAGEAVLAALTGDLAAASDRASALDALRLLTLALDWRIGGDLVATQCAPVAVTPDELGDGWAAGRLQARLVALHNGAKLEPRDVTAAPGDALARLARLRALRAGQAAGVALGALDLSLAAGDSLHLDLKTAAGQSLFGAIDLDIAPAPSA
ncbi:fumarylacetoacetate hydrolase [Roseateles sp. BYS96W]|uniref:Fumarylacetoacetate hydrolase n=1 Tax=Pelomonas nitida TaxID=3299027 RepID=A0ABW7G866_9BURK